MVAPLGAAHHGRPVLCLRLTGLSGAVLDIQHVMLWPHAGAQGPPRGGGGEGGGVCVCVCVCVKDAGACDLRAACSWSACSSARAWARSAASDVLRACAAACRPLSLASLLSRAWELAASFSNCTTCLQDAQNSMLFSWASRHGKLKFEMCASNLL